MLEYVVYMRILQDGGVCCSYNQTCSSRDRQLVGRRRYPTDVVDLEDPAQPTATTSDGRYRGWRRRPHATDERRPHADRTGRGP